MIVVGIASPVAGALIPKSPIAPTGATSNTVTLVLLNVFSLAAVVSSVPFCTITLPATVLGWPAVNGANEVQLNVAVQSALSTFVSVIALIFSWAFAEIAASITSWLPLSAAAIPVTAKSSVIAANTASNSPSFTAAATFTVAVPGVPAVPVAVTVIVFAVEPAGTVNIPLSGSIIKLVSPVTSWLSASTAVADHVTVLSVASSGATVAVNAKSSPPAEILAVSGLTVTLVTGTSPGSSSAAFTVTVAVAVTSPAVAVTVTVPAVAFAGIVNVAFVLSVSSAAIVAPVSPASTDHVISASAANPVAVNSTVWASVLAVISFVSGVIFAVSSSPGPGSGVGVGVGVTGLSDTSGILSPELDVSIVLLSVASILFTVPSPVTSEPFAVDVDVIVSTFASSATSTFAVAVSESSTFPTLALSFTATSALALSLTFTLSTVAFPFNATLASTLSFTSTFSTLAPFLTATSVLPSPFNTMSFASPVTFTLSTLSAVSATSRLASSPNSTVPTLAPSATSTGAVASTLSIANPSIAVATFATTDAPNFLGVRVLITTWELGTLFSTTVIVPLTLVLPSK